MSNILYILYIYIFYILVLILILLTKIINNLNRIHDVEEKYYADGEDAYNMRKYFVDKSTVPSSDIN